MKIPKSNFFVKLFSPFGERPIFHSYVEYFSSMAEQLGLIVTGGSDFHAPNIMNGQIILGKNFVPEWIYENLLEEKRRLDLA